MERLFSPCTRLHDLVAENQDETRDLVAENQDETREILIGGLVSLPELNLDVSTEAFLSAERAFTYVDLYDMLGRTRNTVAWLTPHAAVVLERGVARDYWGNLEEDYSFYFRADGKTIVAMARSAEALGEICYVIRQLVLADVSELYELELRNAGDDGEGLFNALNLADLMECQSLGVLTLGGFKSLDEEHISVLGFYSRPDLEIELHDCHIRFGAASELSQVLGRNQGPTKLTLCNIDYSVVADGLRGNSRLKSLIQHKFDTDDLGNRHVLAIASALRENKGLTDVGICYNFWMSDEAWYAFCDSLKTHPTLEVLRLCTSGISSETSNAPATKINTRSQAILDMMKENRSLHAIDLDSRYRKHDLYRRSVPYLETNRLRPRLRAIQKKLARLRIVPRC